MDLRKVRVTVVYEIETPYAPGATARDQMSWVQWVIQEQLENDITIFNPKILDVETEFDLTSEDLDTETDRVYGYA